MTKKHLNSRKLVKVTEDSRGHLRLQFCSKISQEVWGKRQHYKNIGLGNSPENKIKAEAMANEIERDILFNRLDASLEKYSVIRQATEKAENKHPYFTSELTLNSLFDKYLEYIRPHKAETTFIRKYLRIYRRTIEQCPQDIRNTEGIRAKIVELRCTQYAKSLLSILSDMMDWAKITKLIPEDFLNHYRFYQKSIKEKHKPRDLPTMVLKSGAVKPRFKNRGFLKSEILFILEALSERGDSRNKGQWRNPIDFLFRTGFRLGEAAGLQWKYVDRNFEYIYVCQSYEPDYNILKDTKTGVTRHLPCNQQLKEFLKMIKPDNVNPEHFVLGGEKPINFNNINSTWAGHPYTGGSKKEHITVTSVIGELIADGKVEHYYPPYGCRHTWINIQLAAGIPVQNVAEWAGNSPETIWKNYVSYDQFFSEPVEIPIMNILPEDSEDEKY
jgi:integrase